MEMPIEQEMLPKDKYTVFDRKVKRYRKGIHSTCERTGYNGGGQRDANVEQRYRSGRESVRDSILLVSRRITETRCILTVFIPSASDMALDWANETFNPATASSLYIRTRSLHKLPEALSRRNNGLRYVKLSVTFQCILCSFASF